MDIKKQKLIDKILNPQFSFFQLLGCLATIVVFAGIGAFFDIVVLNLLHITFSAMPTLDKWFLLKIIAFFLITCGILILGTGILISIFIKNTKTITGDNEIETTDNEVLYDMMYELIDNVFRCLAIFGILYQIAKNIEKLTDPQIDVQSNIVATLILFGLIMGVQQLILKVWFKTVRKFGDENFVQSVYLLVSHHDTKKKLKKHINNYNEINNRVKGNIEKEKKELEDSEEDIFSFLDEKNNIEVLDKFYKTKPIVDITKTKEFTTIKKSFFDSKDKSGIHRKDIKEQFDKIKKYL